MTPIEWLDHTADVGFRAIAPSLDEAFALAAQAVFSVMLDLTAVQPRDERRIEVHAASVEDLLVEWLSEWLVQRELSGLALSRFSARITETKEGWTAVGWAKGEPLDRERHHPGGEVKGISYLGLKVEPVGTGWEVRAVVDV